VRHLSEWIGKDKLLRDLTRRDMIALRDKLQKLDYAASSQRNYFTVLTSFYKYAQDDLLYPVENIASGIKLPKPENAIQRHWVGDEKERLFKSLSVRSPWMIPIVELSLEMTFRRGELNKRPNTKSLEEREAEAAAAEAAEASGKPIEQTPEEKAAAAARPEYLGGLKWENIDWERSSLTLTEEKNDGTKRATEYKGRTVPLTKRMREILTPLFEASPTKSGYVFEGTVHSVTGAFSNACKKAEPPITKLTFHSMRKVGTKDLAERVSNPMQLGKLSGHKNIDVLYRRYFEVTLDELARLLDDSDGTLVERGLRALTKALGADGAKKFLDGVRTMEKPSDTP
jgi:integrase